MGAQLKEFAIEGHVYIAQIPERLAEVWDGSVVFFVNYVSLIHNILIKTCVVTERKAYIDTIVDEIWITLKFFFAEKSQCIFDSTKYRDIDITVTANCRDTCVTQFEFAHDDFLYR